MSRSRLTRAPPESSWVAARERPPSGVCPAEGGDQAGESAPADSRLASKAKVWIAEPSDWRDPPNCQAKDTQC